ncbi:Uncharacterized protein GBIM_00839 [Gryllus bimaculatus]|nr:Uncharacterized protein GBIM_00839 [Gryllus bimaculatus]
MCHRLRGAATDEVDGGSRARELESLVGRLQGDLSHISMLGGKELELLSNMDPESLTDIIPDSRIFLVQLKEASGRFLSEKRQAQDALDLLRLYHSAQRDSPVAGKKEKV